MRVSQNIRLLLTSPKLPDLSRPGRTRVRLSHTDRIQLSWSSTCTSTRVIGVGVASASSTRVSPHDKDAGEHGFDAGIVGQLSLGLRNETPRFVVQTKRWLSRSMGPRYANQVLMACVVRMIIAVPPQGPRRNCSDTAPAAPSSIVYRALQCKRGSVPVLPNEQQMICVGRIAAGLRSFLRNCAAGTCGLGDDGRPCLFNEGEWCGFDR